MSNSTNHQTVDAANRDQQEFDAKILDIAAKASNDEQEAAKRIVDNKSVISVETITPIIAALLFVELNKHNRDFSLSKAHYYAEQMRKGYWRLIHQGLAFYPTRRLADGQHRIAAVFLSDTTQQFTVFRNFADDAMEAIDTAKRRTAGDAFGISGLVAKNDAKVGGSIVEAVMRYEHRRLYAKSITPSIYEQKDWATTNKKILTEALAMTNRLSKGDPVLTKPEVGAIALGLLLGGYSADVVEGYLSDILEALGRYPESPAVDLHRQFRKAKETAAKAKTISKEEKLALAFKGAALYVNKHSTAGLRWKVGKEPMPAPTPPEVLSQAAAE
jgi:hypothetical protein